MPLEAFCEQYKLNEGIFKDNKYKHTHMFHFLTLKDLEAIKFMVEEVAEVWDAIDQWSVIA